MVETAEKWGQKWGHICPRAARRKHTPKPFVTTKSIVSRAFFVTARGLADAESVPSATARVIPLLLGIIFFAADSRGQVRRGERDAANDVPGHRAARAPATHARSAEQKQWPRPETDEEATREEAP